MNRFIIFAAAAFAVLAAPARADPLPRPEAIALPEERALLPRFVEAIGRSDSPSAARAEMETLLAQLPRPTAFRGLIQFFRANALAAEDRDAEAVDAILESIRLLPNHSAPLLAASRFYTFSNQPDRAADYLLRASRLDPALVNQLDDYNIVAILTRLRDTNDRQRAAALSERLLETGWSKGSSRTISGMAMEVIEARIGRGDFSGAAAMVPKIVSPSVFSQLLTEKQFEPLRPAVEAWAGPRLEKQWEIYLEQARAEWEASHDLEAGLGYARALSSAGHDATLAATFEPRFDKPIDPRQDQDLVFIAPIVAGALARLGRWYEAFKLLDKALAGWPQGSWANALNLSSNRARLLFYKGDFEAAVAQLERDLDNAAKWRGQVNEGAIASMHLYRACALEQLGRGDEAASSSAIVTSRKRVSPASFAYLQLCRNDIGWARQALLQALETEDTRGAVIAWMQPSNEETYASDFAKLMQARARRLRTDEELVAAVQKHGRILAEPINAAAPPETPGPGSKGW